MKHDLVLIEGLEIRTVIGIYDWEREIRQTVRLDIEMAWDVSKAGQSDDIADTLDYFAVSQRLIEYVEGSEFALVEALIENCANLILQEFFVPWLRIKITKPLKNLGMDSAAIVIERRINK